MLIDHPRPQLRRGSFLFLDGSWMLNGAPVTVPFPPRSEASGWHGNWAASEKLIYEKTFQIPAKWQGKRILLHFGAADQTAVVSVNGRAAGSHIGGYLPFSFEITDLLEQDGETENTLRVEVTDTLSHALPYGKQSADPGGMWYTPVSGIWQSVWLEAVPAHFIESLVLDPSCEGTGLSLSDDQGQPVTEFELRFIADEEAPLPDMPSPDAEPAPQKDHFNRELNTDWHTFHGQKVWLDIHDFTGDPVCWTPGTPQLYHMEIRAFGGMDTIKTYFALRTVETGERNGIPGIFLNGKRIFLHGVLDQGYFPDGIFTPSDPREYIRDILRMKQLGINLLRKHIKIEPEAFYYACDYLGMLVMQDMVNSGPYHYIKETLLPNLGLRRRCDRSSEDVFYRVFGERKGLKSSLSEKPENLRAEHPGNDPSPEGPGSPGTFRAEQITAYPGNAYPSKEPQSLEIFRKRFFVYHVKETVRHLYDHPSIIAWTIFNEGWGQFDSDMMYDIVKEMDPTRPIDTASGWFAQKKSDFDSRHIYFFNRKLHPGKRPLFLTECGGYSLKTYGPAPDPSPAGGSLHASGTAPEKGSPQVSDVTPAKGSLQAPAKGKEKTYGYGACKTKEELTDRILAMYEKMVLPAIPEGLCGCIYTQLSDIEEEINGFYTYDRKTCKVLAGPMKELAARIARALPEP